MPLAGTPVQPMCGRLLPAMGNAGGEAVDLLPFAAGAVATEQFGGVLLRGRRAGARQPGGGSRGWWILRQLAQFKGALGQLGEGLRCALEQLWLVVRSFGLLEGATAQPASQLRVIGFPGQNGSGEGTWPPQCLVLKQPGIQFGKAGSVVHARISGCGW